MGQKIQGQGMKGSSIWGSQGDQIQRYGMRGASIWGIKLVKTHEI